MKVFINPGHAPGIDPGAVGQTGLQEADVARNVGKLVEHYLNAVGVTTESCQDDDLEYVCEKANNSGADLFVSIHCNAASPAAEGTETWFCAGSYHGKILAGFIQEQIVEALGTVDRYVKEAMPGRNGLYVLTNTDCPAVLVELAFISNEDDEELLANNQDDFARAVARGITDYISHM